VTSSFAGLAMASMPLFVLPLAYLFKTNESLDGKKFIGLIIGFVGIIILFSPDFSSSKDVSPLQRLVNSLVSQRPFVMPVIQFSCGNYLVLTL